MKDQSSSGKSMRLIISIMVFMIGYNICYSQIRIDNRFWNMDGSSKYEHYRLDSVTGFARYFHEGSEYVLDIPLEEVIYTEKGILDSIKLNGGVSNYDFENGTPVAYSVNYTWGDYAYANYTLDSLGKVETGSGGSLYDLSYHEWTAGFRYYDDGNLNSIGINGKYQGTPTGGVYTKFHEYQYNSNNDLIGYAKSSSSTFANDPSQSYSYKDTFVYEGLKLSYKVEDMYNSYPDTTTYNYDGQGRIESVLQTWQPRNGISVQMDEYNYLGEDTLVQSINVYKGSRGNLEYSQRTVFYYTEANGGFLIEDFRYENGDWVLTGTGEKRFNEDGILIHERWDRKNRDLVYHYSKIADSSLSSINDADEYELVIYPNPFREYIEINGGEHICEARVEINDLNGRVVSNQKLTTGTNRMEMNPELNPGPYILKIVDNGNLIRSKIIVKK